MRHAFRVEHHVNAALRYWCDWTVGAHSGVVHQEKKTPAGWLKTQSFALKLDGDRIVLADPPFLPIRGMGDFLAVLNREN